MTEAMQTQLEPVIREFTTGEYYPEVFRAKEEFFARAGVVHDDDAEFGRSGTRQRPQLVCELVGRHEHEARRH